VDPGIDRLERPLEVEVHVRDDRHRRLGDDLSQRVGVLALGHRDADHVGTRRGELLDLRQAPRDVVGVPRGHRLDADWCGLGRAIGHRMVGGKPPSDADIADAVIAERDLAGWSSLNHCGPL